MVDAYDYEAIKEITFKYLEEGKHEVKFRCASKSVLDTCIQKLVNEYQMPEIIKEANASLGKNISDRYTYGHNDELYTLTFNLTE